MRQIILQSHKNLECYGFQSETVIHLFRAKSVGAFIARMQLMTILLPTHMISDHASLARLDLSCAFSNLPSLAKLFAINVNLAVVGHGNAWLALSLC